MPDDNDFQKPKLTPTAAPFRNPAAQANVARDMVNMHLQGRNPQRIQTSQAIHARARPGPEKAFQESKERTGTNISPLSRPKTGTSREISTGSSMSRPGAQSFEPKAGISRPGTASNTKEKSPGSAANPQLSTCTKPHVKSNFKTQVSVPAASHVGPCKNPQCDHCGTVIIPSPKASWPAHEEPSITVNDWSIYTTKGPICSSDELDFLNETRFDFPLPEMIFGKNRVLLVNDKTGAAIEFNTLDALDSLAPAADFKVAYYKEWLSTRPGAHVPGEEGGDGDNLDESSVSGISVNSTTSSAATSTDLQSVKPYDWTYSTNYKGTLRKCKFTPTTQQIPLDKLVRPDPILFYDESILFEDELGDNGISVFSTRIRVMHSCLLLLCRFSMRVDDVAFRIRDTRIYIDLETNEVLREYKVQQASYDELLSKVSGRSVDPKKLLRDSNWVSQNTPLVSREVEIMESEQ